VVAAIAAVTAAGQVDAGLPYGVLCVLFLLGCLASMRAARIAPAVKEPRPLVTQVRPLAVLLVTATVIAGGLLKGLPRLADIVERRISAMLGGDGEEATAFSTTMILGSTRGMLESSAIVLRIDGERPEYLRGAVYDQYKPPFWVTTEPNQERRRVNAPISSAPDTPRITLVRGAPVGADMRWFLPPGACELGVSSGKIEIDALGIARRSNDEDPKRLTFRTSGCSTPPATIAPPGPTDLEVPARVRWSLTPIAAGWTAFATTDKEKLEAIEHELSRFEYSLAVPRDLGLDPVVDFVAVHRAGHCEMFASAMVLMARTQGIPARVVGGYRVTEFNPITRRAVVRDRNAHAWVEAWVDGEWHGWDPTPASEAFRTEAGALDHIGDLVAGTFDRIAFGLARLGSLAILAFLAGLVAFLLALRWLGSHLQTRKGRRTSWDSARPLPCFEELTALLAQCGHERADHEPLEMFARRLRDVDTSWSDEVAQALLDYAGLRYGGVGQERSVVAAVERAVRSVRSRATSSRT
jgi:transglutaminase-like putative cysteine protease